MCEYNIVLEGRPITKKTSQRIVTAGDKKKYILQKKSYSKYEKNCLWQLNPWMAQFKKWDPIAEKVDMLVKYWMPNNIGEPDLVGLLQATCDVLEKAKVLDNDKYVRRFGIGPEHSEILGIDKENPRAEITLKIVKGGRKLWGKGL